MTFLFGREDGEPPRDIRQEAALPLTSSSAF
jgi:hypothetical protein